MYEIAVDRSFSAAHALRLADGSLEPTHGHNWSVRITVRADQLDAIETVMDFHVLEQWVDAILAPVNNCNFNDLPPFDAEVNPTAERVAWWISQQLAPHLTDQARLQSVRVGEAPGCFATYRP